MLYVTLVYLVSRITISGAFEGAYTSLVFILFASLSVKFGSWGIIKMPHFWFPRTLLGKFLICIGVAQAAVIGLFFVHRAWLEMASELLFAYTFFYGLISTGEWAIDRFKNKTKSADGQ